MLCLRRLVQHKHRYADGSDLVRIFVRLGVPDDRAWSRGKAPHTCTPAAGGVLPRRAHATLQPQDESSIVGNTLSAESDAHPQVTSTNGGERYRKKGLHGCTKQQLQAKQPCLTGAAQRTQERRIRQPRYYTRAQQPQYPFQTLRENLHPGV